MKRFLSLLLAMLLAFSFVFSMVACSDDSDDGDDEGAGTGNGGGQNNITIGTVAKENAIGTVVAKMLNATLSQNGITGTASVKLNSETMEDKFVIDLAAELYAIKDADGKYQIKIGYDYDSEEEYTYERETPDGVVDVTSVRIEDDKLTFYLKNGEIFEVYESSYENYEKIDGSVVPETERENAYKGNGYESLEGMEFSAEYFVNLLSSMLGSGNQGGSLTMVGVLSDLLELDASSVEGILDAVKRTLNALTFDAEFTKTADGYAISYSVDLKDMINGIYDTIPEIKDATIGQAIDKMAPVLGINLTSAQVTQILNELATALSTNTEVVTVIAQLENVIAKVTGYKITVKNLIDSIQGKLGMSTAKAIDTVKLLIPNGSPIAQQLTAPNANETIYDYAIRKFGNLVVPIEGVDQMVEGVNAMLNNSEMTVYNLAFAALYESAMDEFYEYSNGEMTEETEQIIQAQVVAQLDEIFNMNAKINAYSEQISINLDNQYRITSVSVKSDMEIIQNGELFQKQAIEASASFTYGSVSQSAVELPSDFVAIENPYSSNPDMDEALANGKVLDYYSNPNGPIDVIEEMTLQCNGEAIGTASETANGYVISYEGQDFIVVDYTAKTITVTPACFSFFFLNGDYNIYAEILFENGVDDEISIDCYLIDGAY